MVFLHFHLPAKTPKQFMNGFRLHRKRSLVFSVPKSIDWARKLDKLLTCGPQLLLSLEYFKNTESRPLP